jgi:hypothetical protein
MRPSPPTWSSPSRNVQYDRFRQRMRSVKAVWAPPSQMRATLTRAGAGCAAFPIVRSSRRRPCIPVLFTTSRRQSNPTSPHDGRQSDRRSAGWHSQAAHAVVMECRQEMNVGRLIVALIIGMVAMAQTPLSWRSAPTLELMLPSSTDCWEPAIAVGPREVES